MDQGLWGVEVKSLDSGRVLYALNARKLMMPAVEHEDRHARGPRRRRSAGTIGSRRRWKPRPTSTTGVLKGDLIVRGTGDPTINSRDKRAAAVFDQWAAALRRPAVSRIDGNVVGDATAFDRRRLGQGWSWDYLQDGYAAPSGALEFNEDIATLTIRPGPKPGDDAAIEVTPGAGLGTDPPVVTGAPGSATKVEVERQADGAWLDVTGSIALRCAAGVARGSRSPTRRSIRALAAAGAGRARHSRQGRAQGDGGLAVLNSPHSRAACWSSRNRRRSGRIATTMMKVSQNLYAETLFEGGGAAKSGGGRIRRRRHRRRADIFAAWANPARHLRTGRRIRFCRATTS